MPPLQTELLHRRHTQEQPIIMDEDELHNGKLKPKRYSRNKK